MIAAPGIPTSLSAKMFTDMYRYELSWLDSGPCAASRYRVYFYNADGDRTGIWSTRRTSLLASIAQNYEYIFVGVVAKNPAGKSKESTRLKLVKQGRLGIVEIIYCKLIILKSNGPQSNTL